MPRIYRAHGWLAAWSKGCLVAMMRGRFAVVGITPLTWRPLAPQPCLTPRWSLQL